MKNNNHQLIVCISACLLAATFAGGCSQIIGIDSAKFLDIQAPLIEKVILNSDTLESAEYTGTPFVGVRLKIKDNSDAVFQIAEADYRTGECNSFDEKAWKAYEGLKQESVVIVSALDGNKKICAWARDKAGNQGAVAIGNIKLKLGFPPVIEKFCVANKEVAGPTDCRNSKNRSFKKGDTVYLSYLITDRDDEGLNQSPVKIEYTLDNQTWNLISECSNVVLGKGEKRLEKSCSSFKAPVGSNDPGAVSGDYFRIRLTARDDAGNWSVPSYSDLLNVKGLGVFAGHTDRALLGSALSAKMYSAGSTRRLFVIHPMTQDTYFLNQSTDSSGGLYRLVARTGKMELILKSKAGVVLGESTQLKIGETEADLSTVGTSLAVDSKGRIYFTQKHEIFAGYPYITNGSLGYSSFKVFQINLETQEIRKYVGGGLKGGTVNPAQASQLSANDLFVSPTPISFDEENSLYLLSLCNPELRSTNENLGHQILKVKQDGSGNPSNVERVAGNCTLGRPGDNVAALDTPLLPYNYHSSIGSIVAYDKGQKVYFGHYHLKVNNVAHLHKFINGQSYKTSIPSKNGGMGYNPLSKTMYVANADVLAFTPIEGAGAESSYENVATANGAQGSGVCTEDYTPTNQACVNVDSDFHVGVGGVVFFVDGPEVNGGRDYRIRFIDSRMGRIFTLAGAMPFHQDGISRTSLRSSIAGITYLNSDVNGFSKGLYFMDSSAAVLAKVEELDPEQKVKILIGNQSGNLAVYKDGDSLSAQSSLGKSYSGGDVSPITLSTDGQIVTRYSSVIAKFNSDMKVTHLMEPVRAGVNPSWFKAPEGGLSYKANATVYGARQNLTMAGDVAFFIGGYEGDGATAASTVIPAIRAFDFSANGKVTTIMKGQLNDPAGPEATGDAVKSSALSTTCRNFGSCYVQYVPTQDRLFFTDGNLLRKIENPLNRPNGGTHALRNVCTTPTGKISQFILSPDGLAVFYLKISTGIAQSTGILYRHPLNQSGNCADEVVANLNSVRLPTPNLGANQLTWMGDHTLLISGYDGNVYYLEI